MCMGYDSLSDQTGEYVKDRERYREEFEEFYEEYGKFEDAEPDVEKLDEDIQGMVWDIRQEYDAELKILEDRGSELETRKEELADKIDQELDRLRAAQGKVDPLAGKKYAGGVKKASEACKDYINQLEGLLDQLDEASSADSMCGAAGDAEYVDNNMPASGMYDGQTASMMDDPLLSDLEPNRTAPRSLSCSQYGFTVDANGDSTYDSPMEMDHYLYRKQGSADANFQGTCGLCAIANVMRLAGVDLSEKDVIDYAANASEIDDPVTDEILWAAHRLCTYNPFNPQESGGTTPGKRLKILEHFGINSGVYSVKMEGKIASYETMNQIADFVAEGRGVILSVHASILEPNMYENDLNHDFHAVTVTSVKKNKYGNISGFYICDSNKGTSFYPIDQVQAALTGADMNVTYSHIR